MITITCDMCGKRLHRLTNEVDLHFSTEGVVLINQLSFNSIQKQLCFDCATKLCDYIDNQLGNTGDDIE